MAKDKKGFILYADQKDIFEELSHDYAGKLIKHIFRYVNDENPVDEDLILKIAFSSIKAQLKRDLKKYEAKRLINSKNAKKRWDATASERMRTNAKHADIGIDIGIVNDKNINILFETFWIAYHSITSMKKTDRNAAEKYWKKLTDQERVKAQENITPYYNSIKDKKYIKKARTYLNDKNFNDEFQEPTPVGVSVNPYNEFLNPDWIDPRIAENEKRKRFAK